MPDVIEAAADADILVFVVPHQFVRGLCKQMKGKIKASAIAVSLIKVSITVALFDCLFLGSLTDHLHNYFRHCFNL